MRAFFARYRRAGALRPQGLYRRSGLSAAGVGRVDVLPHDTCADDERFFSYRRTTLRREDRFGLQLSAIVLEG